MKTTLGLAALLGSLAMACGPAYSGVPGTSYVSTPDVKGTVFTIVFENHDESSVINPKVPYFWQLAQENGRAAAYISSTHPSLPNYIEMTAGAKMGVGNNNDPNQNVKIPGTDNLMAQLDTAGVPWRAYMESMGTPCRLESDKLYCAHHNPFLYYDYVTSDRTKCEQVDVDLDANIDKDLAENKYRYMFIVPNMCNNMHDCPVATGDEWLKNFLPKLLESPGYKNGGAIFVMFDEGSMRVFGASANLATIVLSPNLVSKGFVTNTRFGHESYLATIEDIFRMPRLPNTVDAVPMGEFFQPAAF